ncbi:MAG: thermonuclease family protein [Nitrospiria bacterium]
MMKKLIIPCVPKPYRAAISILFLLLPSLAFGAPFRAKVVDVANGDIIMVMHSGKVTNVHLAEIDCPENKQAFGAEAKQFTSGMVLGKLVTVRIKETDRTDRTLGEVILPDGRSLSRELVKAGLAWWNWKDSTDMRLGELEQRAREKKVGLWKANNPIPPWEFREISSWKSRKKSRILR